MMSIVIAQICDIYIYFDIHMYSPCHAGHLGHLWSKHNKPSAVTTFTHRVFSVHNLLINRSKGRGSGCTTALSTMHRYVYRVYCLTPATSLCSDNTQNLNISTVEQIPRQCPHPRPKVNMLASHPTI